MADVYRPRDAGGGVWNVERFASDGTITVISSAFTEENAALIAEQLQDAYDRGRYDEATAQAEARLKQFADELRMQQAAAKMHPSQWEDRPRFADFLNSLLNDQPKPEAT